MEKIASFTVNHLLLEPGIYVSRKDQFGQEVLTTFDLRMTTPNREAVMSTAEVHTIEHLGATFLRNHPLWKNRTVYFGPMGCRTGFYLILHGDLDSCDVVDPVKEMFRFVVNFEGDIPGASAKECGNCLDQNLPVARYRAQRYLKQTLENIDSAHMVYPQ
ncbi:MAG: S-ribosylhomocysteine lyase [Bulleidia sp.]